MIKIVAEMNVKPECLDTFLATAKELVDKSTAEEGNLVYTLNQGLTDPCALAFIETWKDQAAVDFHNASAHFNTIFPKLQELCVSTQLKIYKEVGF